MTKMRNHDWADDQAVRILRPCRQAMRGDARLLLIEQRVPEQLPQDSQRCGSRASFAQAGPERTKPLGPAHRDARIEAKPIG